MATSGMPMLAFCVNRWTVARSHCSVSLRGLAITCAPVLHLAICLEMSNEKIAPVKPTTAENASSIGRSSPVPVRKRLTPSKLVTTPNTSMTAMLVTRNRNTRFIGWSFPKIKMMADCTASRGIHDVAEFDTRNRQNGDELRKVNRLFYWHRFANVQTALREIKPSDRETAT